MLKTDLTKHLGKHVTIIYNKDKKFTGIFKKYDAIAGVLTLEGRCNGIGYGEYQLEEPKIDTFLRR